MPHGRTCEEQEEGRGNHILVCPVVRRYYICMYCTGGYLRSVPVILRQYPGYQYLKYSMSMYICSMYMYEVCMYVCMYAMEVASQVRAVGVG